MTLLWFFIAALGADIVARIMAPTVKLLAQDYWTKKRVNR